MRKMLTKKEILELVADQPQPQPTPGGDSLYLQTLQFDKEVEDGYTFYIVTPKATALDFQADGLWDFKNWLKYVKAMYVHNEAVEEGGWPRFFATRDFWAPDENEDTITTTSGDEYYFTSEATWTVLSIEEL